MTSWKCNKYGNVRSILEYAIQVRWDIPEYLSDRIDCIQKRALKIIYPECTAYNQGLLEANVSSLANVSSICLWYD